MNNRETRRIVLEWIRDSDIEEVYEIQRPGTENYKSYHTAVEEVAYDIVEGLRCGGCELVIVGEGTKCFCEDELIPILAAAHETARWCSEKCLVENHEDPSMEKSYPALLEETE